MADTDLYESDFYGWAVAQSALLRHGQLDRADIGNIAEELESLGRSERRELVDRLAIVLLHLIKWQVQAALRGPSWRLSIEEQRYRLAVHLKENPSLKPQLAEAIDEAYRLAIIKAERQTKLPRKDLPFPCPYTSAQILDDGFWPSDPESA